MDADVCVIPSYSENFCNVVTEALAKGLPVIVSDRLAWCDVAKHGCGLVVGNDPDSLAKAIQRAQGMELSEMGRIGWQWMRNEFEWDHSAHSMLAVYESMRDKTYDS